MALSRTPSHQTYDLVVIGGGMIGASVAWWCARDPGFGGRILVVERDPTYEFASTTHTNSCIRQQFGSAINVRISQFGARFIREFRAFIDDDEAPEIGFRSFGYLYLADSAARAAELTAAQRLQAFLGAGTRMMTPDEIAAEYPFYDLDGIEAGSHNTVDEGWFDGATIFDWWRRKNRQMGVETVQAEVTGLTLAGPRVTGIVLADGTQVSAGTVVNAAGPIAARIAAMADVVLPVEPRRRFTYVFEAAEPLPRPLPLTIDPSGFHVRSDGAWYMAGCPPEPDETDGPTDFRPDHALWEDRLWPALATRIPAFERVRLRNSWVGHYAYNTLDQNALLGPYPGLDGMLFANGFSGHGLQQAPAVGRGIAEWVIHGGWQSLDLSPLGLDRLLTRTPHLERAII